MGDHFDALPADIVLLGPKPLGPGEAPISQTVLAIDSGGYSHAVLVETREPNWWLLSANQEKGVLHSGVNAVPASVLLADRKSMLLRPRCTPARRAAAVAHASTLVEFRLGAKTQPPASADEVDFAWEQLFLSGVAGVVRRMEPDSKGRDAMWRLIHGLSAAIDEIVPWSKPRWDCCECVVRVYEESGTPLRIVESDPGPRDAGRVLRVVLGEWLHFVEARDLHHGAPTPPPAIDPALERHVFEACTDDDDESLREDIGSMLRVLRDIAHRAHVHMSALVGASAPQLGEPVWTPFVSPRLLREACKTVDRYGRGVRIPSGSARACAPARQRATS